MASRVPAYAEPPDMATSEKRLDVRSRWWVLGVVALLVIGFLLVTGRARTPAAPEAEDTAGAPDGRGGQLTNLTSPQNEDLSRCRPGSDRLGRCGQAPAFRAISRWFNTAGGRPLPLTALRGKVVLVDFWAYSCINCRRHQPYLNAWYDAYRDAGLVVLGVQSPQWPFERDPAHLAAAVRSSGIEHPVALDATRATMTAYRDRYWPATYLVDAGGTVRALSFGEGGEVRTERHLRSLLREADPSVRLPRPVTGSVRTATPPGAGTTPEVRFGSSVGRGYQGTPARPVPDADTSYAFTAGQPDDTYSLRGVWRVGTASAQAVQGSQVRVSVRSRDVFAVVGGTGTLSVSGGGRPDRTIEITGRPDLRRIFDGTQVERRVLTLQASAGLDLYAISVG